MARKTSERSCPTCHTPESKTPGGKARAAIQAAQSARQSQPRPPMPQPSRPPMSPMMPMGRPMPPQAPGAGIARAMQQPPTAMPASFTGAAPGQMEQAALRRMLTQRMMELQQRQRGGR